MTDQITLPGQAATPTGPLDMTMMYVMHHAFRRDLRVLTAAAERTPTEDRRTWAALADRWAVFADVLHHHHTGEDRGYWPLLAARVRPGDRDTLHAMEAEHAAIDPLLAQAGRGFAAMSGRTAYAASEATRQGLVDVLSRATAHLEVHLAHEETDAIPLLHAHVTPAEDERIEAEHFRGPATVRQVLATVPWALHGLPREVRERVFAVTGAPFRVVWWLTRPGFERRDRRALRHL